MRMSERERERERERKEGNAFVRTCDKIFRSKSLTLKYNL